MNDEKRRELRKLTVSLLVDLRAEYLAAGASPLKHWDQLQDRLRVAARTSETFAQWATMLDRLLGLGAPSKARSSATVTLADAIGVEHTAFLVMVEEDTGLIMALARQEAERRKSAVADRLREEAELEAEARAAMTAAQEGR